MSGGSYCYCCFANYVSLASGAVNYAVVTTACCTSSFNFVFYFCFSRGMLCKLAVRLITDCTNCLFGTCCITACMTCKGLAANVTVVIVGIICACANRLFTIIASMRAGSRFMCAYCFATISVITNVVFVFVHTCVNLRLRGSRCLIYYLDCGNSNLTVSSSSCISNCKFAGSLSVDIYSSFRITVATVIN